MRRCCLIGLGFLTFAALTSSESASAKILPPYLENVLPKPKPQALHGTITCAKCDLGVSKKCDTVIVVGDPRQMGNVIHFDTASHKKYHGDICTEAKKGAVTGLVSIDNGRSTVSVANVIYEP